MKRAFNSRSASAILSANIAIRLSSHADARSFHIFYQFELFVFSLSTNRLANLKDIIPAKRKGSLLSQLLVSEQYYEHKRS